MTTEAAAKHYHDGYRMDFVSAKDVKNHQGLMNAYKKNQEQRDNNPDSD